MRLLVLAGLASLVVVALSPLGRGSAQQPEPAAFSHDKHAYAYPADETVTLQVSGLQACAGQEVEVVLLAGDDTVASAAVVPVAEDGTSSATVATPVAIPTPLDAFFFPAVRGACLPGGMATGQEPVVVSYETLKAFFSPDKGAYFVPPDSQAVIGAGALATCAGQRFEIGIFARTTAGERRMVSSGDAAVIVPDRTPALMAWRAKVPLPSAGEVFYPGAQGACVPGGAIVSSIPLRVLRGFPEPVVITTDKTFYFAPKDTLVKVAISGLGSCSAQDVEVGQFGDVLDKAPFGATALAWVDAGGQATAELPVGYFHPGVRATCLHGGLFVSPAAVSLLHIDPVQPPDNGPAPGPAPQPPETGAGLAKPGGGMGVLLTGAALVAVAWALLLASLRRRPAR